MATTPTYHRAVSVADAGLTAVTRCGLTLKALEPRWYERTDDITWLADRITCEGCKQ